ncbi:uncharacterized protein A4U43_C04F3420 [Asparagus officinalis]|uniref:Pectinesterase n=1 Tax=Asparagus officinalis TaxID=4686 RepID=A0A5P1EYM6_ASPOF|nr:probable pectinesterase/pectinesterase inhibitor 12 [Asparagus officinalis]ONK70974.1 uncharacterized protein A4U43_C04F3420 [Asparagus officinalis]
MQYKEATKFQDTLYARYGQQFYRECNISGTVDFIFGDASDVFQNCMIYIKLPMQKQYNIITAHGRDKENEATGFSMQNFSILSWHDLVASNGSVKTYLGRPWRNYSTTVYIRSYMDRIVDPSGWRKWSNDDNPALYKVHYDEYANYGLGNGTQQTRINWPRFHWMQYKEATKFRVSQFINSSHIGFLWKAATDSHL